MPLILAIEPDRRQANQLNTIARGRLHAELVIAESAEKALAALGQRVPDLILTSALLSPTDEVVLGERLRALDATAAHVQTLTIPVLASGRSHGRSGSGGMLSALRRSKARDASPEGCDPDVFAEQVADYLERARAERALRDGVDDQFDDDVAPVVAPPPAAPAPPVVNAAPEEWIEQLDRSFIDSGSSVVKPAASGVKPPAPPEKTAAAVTQPAPPVVKPAAPIVKPAAPVANPAAPGVKRAASAAKSSAPAKTKRTAAVPVKVDETSAAATVQEAVARLEAMAEADAFEEFGDETIPAATVASSEESFADADQADSFVEFDLSTMLDDQPSRAPKRAVQVEEPEIYDITTGDDVPIEETPAPARAATSRRAPHKPANDLNVPAAAPAAASPVKPQMEAPALEAATPPAAAAAPAAPKRPYLGATRMMPKPKPVQDEWGFFDPEQCGFAALLAKLDEIMDTEDKPRRRRA